MAVDEALLHEAATSGIAALRFYRWSRPTLSLGYFQSYADRQQHGASVEADCVRRQSGGGAILHDHELTYSLAVPRGHPLAADAESLYNAVHGEIIAALRRCLPNGFAPTRIYPYAADTSGVAVSKPFLCFERRTRGDVLFAEVLNNQLVSTHKIAGSAQRRSRGAVLQHGSILIARSEYAPELAGLADVCDNSSDTTSLASDLSNQICRAVGLNVIDRTLSDQSSALANTLEVEKYRNRLWLERR